MIPTRTTKGLRSGRAGSAGGAGARSARGCGRMAEDAAVLDAENGGKWELGCADAADCPASAESGGLPEGAVRVVPTPTVASIDRSTRLGRQGRKAPDTHAALDRTIELPGDLPLLAPDSDASPYPRSVPVGRGLMPGSVLSQAARPPSAGTRTLTDQGMCGAV